MSVLDALYGPTGGEDRAALVDAETGDVWSYSRLRETAHAVRDSLPDETPGLIAWFSRPRPDRVAAYLGSLESRHAVLPLSPDLSEEAKRGLLAAYRPDVLFADPGERLPIGADVRVGGVARPDDHVV